MTQKLDKEDLMYEEIKNCKECKELSEESDLSNIIEEQGECLKDEKSSGERNGRYFTEGEKEYSLSCDSCHAQWVWSKSWITDNGGENVSRNGITFDY